jgi:hypothetical protein
MTAKDEIEIFRINRNAFDVNKYYEFGLATRIDYRDYKNLKYYTTSALKYVGQFVRYDYEPGDDGICEIYFNDNGNEIKIVLDYAGRSCFREHKHLS